MHQKNEGRKENVEIYNCDDFHNVNNLFNHYVLTLC
jgi:hypothetical protein